MPQKNFLDRFRRAAYRVSAPLAERLGEGALSAAQTVERLQPGQLPKGRATRAARKLGRRLNAAAKSVAPPRRKAGKARTAGGQFAAKKTALRRRANTAARKVRRSLSRVRPRKARK